jgi:hypothetical protein
MTEHEKQVLSNMIDSEYYSRQNPMAKDEVLVSIAQKLDLPNKEELTTAFFNTYGRIVKNAVSGQVCSFYMSGMDTSGKCNNCGKNQRKH